MLVKFEAGAEGYEHSHPHEQLTLVVKGAFDFKIDGQTTRVNAGESIYIPSNAKHGVQAIEEGMLFDTFTPVREDLLEKDGVKLD